MVELGYNEPQDIQPGASAILQTLRPCQMCPQRVVHENLSANFTVRGIPNRPCSGYAEYKVRYSANIAVATGGTPGEIQAALAVNGEVLPLTISAATPAAVGDFWHVSGEKTIFVPIGMETTLSVRNASVSPTPATTPAPVITMRNLNVVID